MNAPTAKRYWAPTSVCRTLPVRHRGGSRQSATGNHLTLDKHSQKRSFLHLISLWTPSSCRLGVGKVGKETNLQTQDLLLELCPASMQRCGPQVLFQGFTACSHYPLTVIVTPFASPPLIWLPPLPQWAFLVLVSNPEATVCPSFHCLA